MNFTSIINNEPYFTLKWRLTDWCNYRCSYCLRKFKGQDSAPDFERILSVANDVNQLMDGINKPIKLNLIGGEVTWFDLPALFDKLTSKNLKKIHITTNLSNTLQYYIDLAENLEKRDIELSLRCSLHEEYTTITDFLNKAKQLKDACKISKLNIEYVITKENTDNIELIKNECKALNLNVIFELDKTIEDEDFRKQYKNISNPCSNRYSITFEDGSVNTTMTRNELITSAKNNLINTYGYYCSIGLTFLYIKFDKIVENFSCCDEYIPVNQYKIRTSDNLKVCTKKDGCNLCGDFSVFKDKNAFCNHENNKL